MIKLTKKSLITITILLTILCLNLILVYATDNWPMIGHDNQHTGYSTSTILNTNEIKWISNITIPQNFIPNSPVIADGRLIITRFFNWANNGQVQMSRVYAVNSTTGEYLWSYEIAGYRPSSPVIDSGRVYDVG